ncbi:hypothetical protein FLP41_11300 [Paracoccus marcusii]|nr:hypothetical protein FLP41_11300 [Paracoccus marcusii]
MHRIAAAAAAMHRVAEIRRTRISGRLNNHERHVGDDWVVFADKQDWPVRITADAHGADVAIAGRTIRVEGDWRPASRWRGWRWTDAPGAEGGQDRRRAAPACARADLRVHVRRPRAAELARLMPESCRPTRPSSCCARCPA